MTVQETLKVRVLDNNTTEPMFPEVIANPSRGLVIRYSLLVRLECLKKDISCIRRYIKEGEIITIFYHVFSGGVYSCVIKDFKLAISASHYPESLVNMSVACYCGEIGDFRPRLKKK